MKGEIRSLQNVGIDIRSPTEIVKDVKDGLKPPFRPEVDEETTDANMVALMQCCWDENPEERPNASAIIKRLHKASGGRYVR